MVWLFVFCIEAPIDSLPSEGIRTRWSFQDTCGQSGGSQGFFYCIAMACSRQKEDGSQPVDASEIRRINHWMVQKPCTLWDFNYLKKNYLFLNWWVFFGGISGCHQRYVLCFREQGGAERGAPAERWLKGGFASQAQRASFNPNDFPSDFMILFKYVTSILWSLPRH